MLAIKKAVRTFITADTALVSAFVSTAHIVDAWPQTIETFPLLIITEENQSDMEYKDNLPTMSRVRIKCDIFTKDDAAYPTSSTLGGHVARVFMAQFWNASTNGETPDDTVGVRHRVMRFNREMLPGNL
jgi:hypothetical protein